MRTRRRKGTPLIPLSHTFLFSWGSRRTSCVPCISIVSRCNTKGYYQGSGGMSSIERNQIIRGRNREETYHSKGSELADLLDSARCSLLEGDAVNLLITHV